MKRANPFGVMAVVLLAACQQLDKTVPNENEEHDERKVSIVASIGREHLGRTTSSGSNEGVFSFCSGDEMGIFTEGGSVCKWQMAGSDEGNRWQAENTVKWPSETEAQIVTFYAYSPYIGEAAGRNYHAGFVRSNRGIEPA